MSTHHGARAALAALLVVAAAPSAAQAPTTTFLAATPTRSVLGQPVALTATVVGPSTGLVLLRDGARILGQAPVDGDQATFVVATLEVGAHALTAEYLPDASSQGSRSSALSLTVDPRPTTLVVSGPVPSMVGVGVTAFVTASLVDAATTDPAGTAGTYTAVSGAMTTTRNGHTATLTWSGQVLIAGGRDASGAALASAERFDPTTGAFSAVPATLNAARVRHTATLLQDGRVLIAGGEATAGGALASAELYDPRTGAFTTVADTLRVPRFGHTATLLRDGKVLLTGGISTGGARVGSMELFDPGAQTFALVSTSLATPREGHTATLLADGTNVLVAGGNGTPSVELLTSAPELSTPVANSGQVSLGLDLFEHTATLLPDGSVLFTGGYRSSSGYQNSALAYRPDPLFPFTRFLTSTFSPRMTTARRGHTATLLPGGQLLLCGGRSSVSTVLASAELHLPAHDPAGSVTLTSSDPGDAIVIGASTLHGTGTTTLRMGVQATAVGSPRTLTVAYAGDATHLAAGPASASLVVYKGTPEILWTGTSGLTYGAALGPYQLSAFAAGAGGARLDGTFVYDPPLGAVLDAGSQPLRITFTPADSVNYVSTSTTVTLTVNKATPRLLWEYPPDLSYGEPLGGAQLDASAADLTGNELSGAFTYSPPAGTILPAGYAALRVTFTPANPNYSSATRSAYVYVNKTTPTLVWADPADITYGTDLSGVQLNAVARGLSGLVRGTYAYAPGAGTRLPPGSGQSLTVTFTPSDTANYEPATGSAHLNVRKATPVIDWTPVAIAYGTPLSDAQLSARAKGIDGGALAGTLAYTPARGEVLGAGDRALSVSFLPDDAEHYAPAGGDAILHVFKATPVVRWQAPSPILHGTALGPAQLDATFLWRVNDTEERVPGTAIYSPPAGTVLDAGLGQPLTVEFIPDDVLDYDTPAVASVTIDVVADLAIAPATASVVAGESTTFTASGGSGEGLVWTLDSNGSGGTITAAGVYTAGPTGGAIDIVKVQDAEGHMATATVTVRARTPDDGDGDGGGGGTDGTGGGHGGCGFADGSGAGFPLLAAVLALALAARRRLLAPAAART